MDMPTDRTIERIFSKLDDISDRLARVETRIEQNYAQNAQDHNGLLSMITEVRQEVDDLRQGHYNQQGELDTSRGRRSVYGNLWQLVLAMVGGGVLIALGGWLAKVIGIFD